jgi:PEP-CTERM motif
MNAPSLQILSGLAVAGAIAGPSVPAHATLQVIADVSGSISACVDNAACDTNSAIGIIQVANGILNGVQINGSIQTSTGTPANPGPDILNTSSLSLINTTGVTKTITVVVSDTDFIGPVASFATSGAGTWQGAVGSHITLNWYDDPENEQGADTPTDTPGTKIHTFSSAATVIADSFHDNFAGPASDTGPFSMTEQAIFTLTPHGELLSRGQTEIKSAIPEPSTWAMVLLGFVGLGYAALRRAGKSQRITGTA